jgi:2-succinyl-6-hydroxy-2,4-cyclohexadiene-1-carboxylate synthase
MSKFRRTLRAGGISLHAICEGSGRPVVILHGFTGSAAGMAEVAAGLRGDYRAIRIDLVGHGRSDAPAAMPAYSMASCVAQLADAVRALDTRPAHWIGYSMGGRAALALCAWHPELAASAVVIGARSGIADAAARVQRVHDDEALADRIERDGVPAFVDHWMSLPLFAGQNRLGDEALAAAREERLANRAHGLANSLRGMGAGAQPFLGDHLAGLRMPICLVAGAEDVRFRAIAEALAQAIPRGRMATIPGAGHAAHLENPQEFLRVVRRFFAEVDAGAESTPRAPATNPAPTQRTPSV